MHHVFRNMSDLSGLESLLCLVAPLFSFPREDVANFGYFRMPVQLMGLPQRHVNSNEPRIVAARQLGTAQPIVRPLGDF
jgi:hypothetical protein